MQITSQKTNAYTVEVIVKDSAKAFEKAREEAINEIAENVSFKGFRKGNVPKDVVVREYGEVRITEQAVNSYLDKHYHKILEKTGGNKYQAAQVLGIDRKTLYRKLAEIEGKAQLEE